MQPDVWLTLWVCLLNSRGEVLKGEIELNIVVSCAFQTWYEYTADCCSFIFQSWGGRC